MAEEGQERSGLQRLPYTESDGEAGPGSRPSVSRSRTARPRRIQRAQRQMSAWSPRVIIVSDDDDVCETSMKTDSKVESGDIMGPIGLLHRHTNGRLEENNDGTAEEEGEVTSPILPESRPPDPSNRREEMEPSELGNSPGPFSDLQPIQRGGVDSPSAPPLPCGDVQRPQQNPTSTPPQAARQLFDTLAMQSQGRFTSQRWRSLQAGNSPDGTDTGAEMLMCRIPVNRRRNLRFPPPRSIQRSRLGNQVGGYSASHFPRSQRSGVASSWRQLRAGIGSEPGTSPSDTSRAAATFLFSPSPPWRTPFPRGVYPTQLTRQPMGFNLLDQGRASPQQGRTGVEGADGRGGGGNNAGNSGTPGGGSGSSEHGQRSAGGGAGGNANANEMGRGGSRDPSPQPGTSPQQQQQQHLVAPSMVRRSNHRHNHHIPDSDRLASGGGRQGLNNVVAAAAEDTVMLSNQDPLHNQNCGGELQGRRGGVENEPGTEEIPEESMPVSEDLVGKADEGEEVESGVRGLSNGLHDLELENKRLLSERDKYLRMYECEVLCQICCERKKNVLALPCSHYNYCQQCLEKHWEGKAERECPLCRQHVSSILCVKIGQ